MSILEGVAGVSAAEVLGLENLSEAGIDGDEAVYLSGSLVEGFGNSSSDLDVFVVGEREPTQGFLIKKSSFSISIHYLGRRRVDFEYWPRLSVLRIAQKLALINPGQDFVAEKLEPVEELFIHRLRIGIPLCNSAALDSLKRQFDFERFQAYLVQQAVHRIDGALEDIVGMLEDGDLDTALFRARDLIGLAVDAYCHWLGNTNTLPKWRVKALQRLSSHDRAALVSRRFWALQFPEAGELRNRHEKCQDYLRDCINFANQVVGWLQP